MANTGYIAPSSVVNSSASGTIATQNWNGTVFGALVGDELDAEDGNFAGWPTGSAAKTHIAIVTGFPFSALIPAGSVINGAAPRLRRQRGAASFPIVKCSIWLVIGGAVVGMDFGDASVDWSTSGLETKDYGGATELGGNSPTRTEVVAGDFGYAVQVTYASGKVASDPGGIIDFGPMDVFFTPPAAGDGLLLRSVG